MSDVQSPVSLDATLAFQTLADGGLSAPSPGAFFQAVRRRGRP